MKVTLRVNGKEYSGWKTVSITRSMESAAGTFDLSFTEKWSGQTESWPILPGAACMVSINGMTVISGYVDDFMPSFDARTHTIRVTGRDKTGDLVDCSAIWKAGQWQNRNLLQIARDLCSPFGISVKAETSVGAVFKTLTIQTGESVFEVLESAARQRGVLLVPNGLGGLLITRASDKLIKTALIEGENMLSASGQFSHKDRFSHYIVKGENAGSDFTTTQHNAKASATVTDKAIKRHRPLVVMAEQQGDAAKLKERAQWEANVRTGRGSTIQAVVQGWTHADGLWTPNTRVHCTSKKLKVDRPMLITSATFTLDEAGTRTDLSLSLPGAFKLLPIPAPEENSAL